MPIFHVKMKSFARKILNMFKVSCFHEKFHVLAKISNEKFSVFSKKFHDFVENCQCFQQLSKLTTNSNFSSLHVKTTFCEILHSQNVLNSTLEP